MNPVVHFEMPYDNRDRAAKFYEKAFGWKPQMLGADMGHYIVVTTAETGADGRPKTPGSINGGLYARQKDAPDQCPSVVIAVDDIRAAMNSVTAAGGKILGDVMEIPGIGQYVAIKDSEGNRVGMLQPLPRS